MADEFSIDRHFNELNSAAKAADALVLMTGHDAFKRLDLQKIKKEMRTRIVIDGRGTLDGQKVEESGFIYRRIGLGT